MKNTDLDQSTIEGRILYYIDRVQKGSSLLNKLSSELEKNRIRLRVLIDAYRDMYGSESIEDLVAAIIKDDALPVDELLFAFSFDNETFKQCTQMINQRNKSQE